MSPSLASRRPPSLPIKVGLGNSQNSSKGVLPTLLRSNSKPLHSMSGATVLSFTSSPHPMTVRPTCARVAGIFNFRIMDVGPHT